MPNYDVQGDFALYLSTKADPKIDADYEPVQRSANLADLRRVAEIAARGDRFKYVAIWRWDYDQDADEILVEEFGD